MAKLALVLRSLRPVCYPVMHVVPLGPHSKKCLEFLIICVPRSRQDTARLKRFEMMQVLVWRICFSKTINNDPGRPVWFVYSICGIQQVSAYYDAKNTAQINDF